MGALSQGADRGAEVVTELGLHAFGDLVAHPRTLRNESRAHRARSTEKEAS
jgi:hypothetical protein